MEHDTVSLPFATSVDFLREQDVDVDPLSSVFPTKGPSFFPLSILSTMDSQEMYQIFAYLWIP